MVLRDVKEIRILATSFPPYRSDSYPRTQISWFSFMRPFGTLTTPWERWANWGNIFVDKFCGWWFYVDLAATVQQCDHTIIPGPCHP